MKKKLSTIILVIVFFVGLSLLLYPSVSDYWNSFHQSQVISEYTEKVAEMDDDEYEAVLKSAREYNSWLAMRRFNLKLSESEREVYNSMLNISEDGAMGYIEIPSIDCTLPIYHGSDDTVLMVGVGHIEGSSLPVGGKSTHCVLSGHRGLPSAKLFSALDRMEVGDVFMLKTLDEVLTYEVDQILVVTPDDVSALQIVPGEDYCTLVTCTPYGVNTHRLLVRGKRTTNLASSGEIRVTADALQIEPMIAAPFAAIPIFTLMIVCLFVRNRKRRIKRKDVSDK
jgi:sortase A